MLEIFGNICKGVIGRDEEIISIVAAIKAGKHVLLEGPPGTSKSTILRSIAKAMQVPFYIIEGNIDLTPSKIVGHFNPAKIMADNYSPDYFEKGPLTKAMEQGGILYIEEFNRMPADVANVLISPMEEGEMYIPRYGTVKANELFTIIAAQNPYDDVGTVRVSRAFMDRICLIKVDYQSEEEEIRIVSEKTKCRVKELKAAAVQFVRKTRNHPDVKLGASVRAAIDLVDIVLSLQKLKGDLEGNFLLAAKMALTNKIWLNEITNRSPEEIIKDIWESIKVKHKDSFRNNNLNPEEISELERKEEVLNQDGTQRIKKKSAL